MDKTAILAKTPKGEEEIQSRAHGLDRNLRYVLILVDGKSTVEQLINEKGVVIDGVEASLQQLIEQGFVEGVAAGMTAPSAASAAGQDFAAIKAEMIAVAQEVLGNDAEKIVAKLQAAADSREGLQEAVEGCKKLVRLVIDEKKAEQLRERCSEVLKKI